MAERDPDPRPGLVADFMAFLRERPLLWLGVFLVAVAILVWLARATVQLPDSPFTYQV